MTNKSSPQECPARVSHKNVRRECPTRVPQKGVPQECPTRVSHKSGLQECFAIVSHKSECHTRCSTRVHKRVPQRFPQRMCPTRVSHKSVSCKSYKSVKNCLGVCFQVRVCIRVRGFHLVSFFFPFQVPPSPVRPQFIVFSACSPPSALLTRFYPTLFSADLPSACVCCAKGSLPSCWPGRAQSDSPTSPTRLLSAGSNCCGCYGLNITSQPAFTAPVFRYVPGHHFVHFIKMHFCL